MGVVPRHPHQTQPGCWAVQGFGLKLGLTRSLALKPDFLSPARLTGPREHRPLWTAHESFMEISSGSGSGALHSRNANGKEEPSRLPRLQPALPGELISVETLAGEFHRSLRAGSVRDSRSWMLQPNKSSRMAPPASPTFQGTDSQVFKDAIIELPRSNIGLSWSCLIPPALSRFQVDLSKRKWNPGCGSLRGICRNLEFFAI